MQNLIETWEISQAMNQFLLEGIKEEHLTDKSAHKGRSIGDQFVHIHNVRLMWLKVAAPELLGTLEKSETQKQVSKKVLVKELQDSSEAVSQLLKAGFAAGRIKGFKPHPEAFLGYIIAHEAHHRGQIILILKEHGHMPDKKTLYGLWEWGTK